MNSIEKKYNYAKNEFIDKSNKTTDKIIGYEQLDWKNILQFSKYNKKKSIAYKFIKNR